MNYLSPFGKATCRGEARGRIGKNSLRDIRCLNNVADFSLITTDDADDVVVSPALGAS